MSKYWNENPNHKIEWGESGGLPIESLTLEGHATRIQQILAVKLLTTELGKAVTDEDGNFVLVGEIGIIYGGKGWTTINARERQLERLLPGSNPPFENVTNNINTGNQIALGPYLAFDGTNWFASDSELVGMTPGFFALDGGGNIVATTGAGPGLSWHFDGSGNVIVEI